MFLLYVAGNPVLTKGAACDKMVINFDENSSLDIGTVGLTLKRKQI